MAFHQYGSLNGVKDAFETTHKEFIKVTPITFSQATLIKVIEDFKNMDYVMKYIVLFKEDETLVSNNSDVKLIKELNKNNGAFSLGEYLSENHHFIGGITMGDGVGNFLTVSNSGKLQSHGNADLMLKLLLDSVS